jgi:hypothetical protein
MLPGRIPEIGETISSRSFHIETNKPILIPIVNWYSFSIAEATERIDVVDQRTFSVLVDGFDVTNHCHRVSNPGFRLEGKLRELEAVEFGPDMLDKAVSDGYWLFIKTLPTGLTKMHTYGSCSSGATRIDMDYELEVL